MPGLQRCSPPFHQRLNDSETIPTEKSLLFEEIGDICQSMGEIERALTFFKLAIFANPVRETVYRKKIALTNPAELPHRRVSVVMPTYNRYHDLVACVRNLRRNTYYPLQIIAVCDQCRDGTVEFLRQENLKEGFIGIVNETRLGSVPSLCLGLTLATGDYVAIINDDVQVKPGWDLEVVTAIDGDNDAGCAVPLVTNSNGTVQSVGQHNDFISRIYPWIGPRAGL